MPVKCPASLVAPRWNYVQSAFAINVLDAALPNRRKQMRESTNDTGLESTSLINNPVYYWFMSSIMVS